MKAFLETTEWPDTEFNCNHVYWMNDSKEKMYAYAQFGNPAAVKVFRNPIRIDARGRRFVEVRNIYGWVDEDETVTSANPTWTVVGSKGDKYTVELDNGEYTCTCSGFKYRGECRHVKEIKDGT